MQDILENITIKMDIPEVEEKIREYYFLKDPSVKNVSVKYSCVNSKGQWNEAWQDYIGATKEIKAEVVISREVDALGKPRKVTNRTELTEDDIVKILSSLMRKNGLVVNCLSPSDKKLQLICKKLPKKIRYGMRKKSFIKSIIAMIK